MAITCYEIKTGHRVLQPMSPSAYPVPDWSDHSSEPFPMLCYDVNKSLCVPNFCCMVLLLLCSTHPEMVCFLKQCYQLHLGSKPTSTSATLICNWVLQTTSQCGCFSDFLLLVCFFHWYFLQ